MTEFRLHGANPEKLYALFGIAAPEKISDFSTNTNAVPQRPGFTPDITAAVEDYPDDECTELRAALSQLYGVPEKNILVTSGANEAIYLLASYTAQLTNTILEPVYGEYRRALEGFDARIERTFDLEKAKLTRGGCLWLCNPDNPTGAFIPDEKIADIAESAPETLFIIDEAYRDFIWTDEKLAPLAIRPNTVHLRSLTKTYNLCGARVGCVIADEEMIKKLKKRQPCWSVSGLAQQAALYYIEDGTILERTKKYYAEEMPRLIAAVREAGFETLPTCVNYFLMRTDDDEKLIKYLLERGIVVRHTRNFAGIDGRCVRIAARTPEDDDLLAAALKEYK